MDAGDSLMALSSRFDDPGDWAIERKFVSRMGSAYLLAHGNGEPLLRDARTEVTVPCSGEYNLWVRTKNWTAFFSDHDTPGIFSVLVDGKEDGTVFGTGCGGETRRERSQWCWQQGGRWFLEEGAHEIALHDLSGFDGRCSAVLLTMGRETPGSSLESFRELCSAMAVDELEAENTCEPEGSGITDAEEMRDFGLFVAWVSHLLGETEQG